MNDCIDITELPLEGSVNRRNWENLNPSQLAEYAARFAEYYQSLGYPYYDQSSKERYDDVKRVIELGSAKIDDEGIIYQKMNGLAFCWHYHPHAAEIPCGRSDARTPYDVFHDKELLTSSILKRMRSKHSTNMSVAAVRKALRAYNGVQAVSNFRPTAAAALYQRFANFLEQDTISTWDMSAGFGGRAFGALISKRVHTYIANEPSNKTFEGLEAMLSDLESWGFIDQDFDKAFVIKPLGSEVWNPTKQVDVSFSSPPYFDTERYSDESTQSWVKYPTYDEWRDGFLHMTINNAAHTTRSGGLVALNIANTRTAKTLEQDALTIMYDCGLTHVETLKLRLSGRPNSGGFRYEPIFVMRKM